MADDANDDVTAANSEAAEIIAAAEAEAAALLEDAERRARERADSVISEYQARLDALLAMERDVQARLQTKGVTTTHAASVEHDEVVDARDRVNGVDIELDSSLADFMKATLRHEVRPD